MKNEPIKVLHIMPQISFAGAELQLYNLIVNSDPLQVTHNVLYYENSDPKAVKLFKDSGIDLTYVPRSRSNPLGFLFAMRKAIKQKNAGVVHCWLFSGSVWGRWSAVIAGSKDILIAYRNCELPRSFFLWLLERIPLKTVRYLGNSCAVADFVSKALGIKRDRFNVIYNGIDIAKFNVAGNKEAFKRELLIPSESKIITMLGRLVLQKNYRMLLDVAACCKKEKLPLHFVIAGKGPLKEDLFALSESLNISDIVHFIGVRQDIPFVLRSSDFYCFTSKFEGFPNVILEAMSVALPIVTTDFAGIREVIEDGKNGRIVPIDDAPYACSVLKEFCSNSQAAIELGKTARKNVEGRFAMDIMVGETIKVYKRMLTK